MFQVKKRQVFQYPSFKQRRTFSLPLSIAWCNQGINTQTPYQAAFKVLAFQKAAYPSFWVVSRLYSA